MSACCENSGSCSCKKEYSEELLKRMEDIKPSYIGYDGKPVSDDTGKMILGYRSAIIDFKTILKELGE